MLGWSGVARPHFLREVGASELAADLGQAEWSVVSGGAPRIDAVAHRARRPGGSRQLRCSHPVWICPTRQPRSAVRADRATKVWWSRCLPLGGIPPTAGSWCGTGYGNRVSRLAAGVAGGPHTYRLILQSDQVGAHLIASADSRRLSDCQPTPRT